MKQPDVEQQGDADAPATGIATIEVCVGRCCRAHAPDLVEHKQRLRSLEQIAADVGGNVHRSNCLGQCARMRVLVARRQAPDGGIDARWLAGVSIGTGIEGLAAWIRGEEPLAAARAVLAAATFDENDGRAGCQCGLPLPNS